MTPEIIQNRLDTCLKHIQEDGLKNLPQVIHDLDYLMNQRIEEERKLSLGQQYMHGSDFYEATQNYYLELLKQYMREFHQMNLQVVEDPNIALAGIAGYDSITDTLRVSASGFLLGGRSKTSSMQTVFHEARHKMQHDSYKAKTYEEAFEYPENMIILAKEEAFITGHSEEFYKTNYENLYIETDADEFGFVAVRILLENLIRRYKHQGNELSMEDEITLRKLQKIMIEDSSKDEQRLYDANRFTTRTRREAMGMDPPTGEFEIDGEKQDRLIAVDQYIKSHPELVMEYPLLNLVMNKDYDEIMKEKASFIESRPDQAERLFQCIINTDPMLYLEDCIRNGKEYELQVFLKKHPTLKEHYPEELKRLAEKTDHPAIKQLIASINQL